MSEKVYVTTQNQQSSGPNSRVRMGEHILAVLGVPEEESSQETNNQEVSRVTKN